MEFINETNDEYINELKKLVIDEYMMEMSKDTQLACTFPFIGIILMAGAYFYLYPVTDNNIFAVLITILLFLFGVVALLTGILTIFRNYRTMKDGLSDEEKEVIYQSALKIRENIRNLDLYTLLKEQNVIKCEVTDYETVAGENKVIVYYETNENIVEEKIIYAVVKKHTKISEQELHLTKDGLVLYIPYNAQVQEG